jgi:hypothetical protein
VPHCCTAQVGNALIVIEEYDKLDCPTRAMFRQLFENLHTANITSGRSVGMCSTCTRRLCKPAHVHVPDYVAIWLQAGHPPRVQHRVHAAAPDAGGRGW